MLNDASEEYQISVTNLIFSWTAMRIEIDYPEPVPFSSIRRYLPKALQRPS